jgi:hypothetical protein
METILGRIWYDRVVDTAVMLVCFISCVMLAVVVFIAYCVYMLVCASLKLVSLALLVIATVILVFIGYMFEAVQKLYVKE